MSNEVTNTNNTNGDNIDDLLKPTLDVNASITLPEPTISLPTSNSNNSNKVDLNSGIELPQPEVVLKKPSIDIPDNKQEPDNEDDKDTGDDNEQDISSNEQQKTTDDILKEFCTFEEASRALSRMAVSPLSAKGVSVKQIDDGIQGLYEFKKNIDAFGKAIREGTPCPVCGKMMKHVPPNSYCSIECFLEDLKKRALKGNTGKNQFGEIMDQIRGVLDMLTLALNLVAEFPQKLIDAAKLPDEYRNYVQVHLNIIFIEIKIVINRLMIIKNNLIKKILEPIQKGIIADKIMQWFSWVKVVVEVVQKLYIALDTTYCMVLKMIQNVSFEIPPESYVWGLTPRSIFTKPGQLYVEVPQSGQLTDLVPGASPMIATYVDKINKIVQGLFPPILAPEYLMPPDIFDIRLAFSDQSDMVKIVYQYLEKYIKIGPEYMPKWEDLTPLNPYFILSVLLGWAPIAKQMFGSFINPYS